MTSAHILWKRLESPGHDACRLSRVDEGWELDGAAAFLERGVPARLDYRLGCDQSFRTQHGSVRGWVGARAVEFAISRAAEGVWLLNPATNLFQLRRLALAVGRAADAPVAWLDTSSGTLELLQQRYERRSEGSYWYEAPRFDYAALLEVATDGLVHRYPGLWEIESATEPSSAR